jgi:CBS-domain-containing membrane protein
MIIRELMRGTIATVQAETSWKDAAQLFFDHHISAAPVVDDHGHVVGILSEKDLFRGLFPSFRDWVQTPESYLDFSAMEHDAALAGSKTVKEVMSSRVLTAMPDTPILKVGALMVASGIHHIPVVEKDVLVGMVGRGDIYRAILKAYFGMERV